MIARSWPNVTVQSVAQQAVALAFKPMWKLRRQVGHELDRLGPACRRVTDIAVSWQMPLRSSVAVAAHIFGRLLALDMAAGTGRPLVRANQGKRMLRQTRFLETGRHMALLAIGAIMPLTRRLVAGDTLTLQITLRCTVAVKATNLSMAAHQFERMPFGFQALPHVRRLVAVAAR
jgi:hypothetical protein